MRAENSGYTSLVHHGDAVGNADHFLHVRGDHQHRNARIGERTHQPVDLRLGADVDSARRLVKNDHAGVHRQPLGEHDLLLVASGKGAGARGQIRRANVEFAAALFGPRALGLVRDRQAARIGAEVWKRDVLGDAEVEHQAHSLAILGHQEDAGFHGIGRACEPHGFAIQQHRAALGRVDAEQRVGEFGAPRADQAGKSQNLAAMKVDADFGEREGLGPQLLHGQDDVAALARRGA